MNNIGFQLDEDTCIVTNGSVRFLSTTNFNQSIEEISNIEKKIEKLKRNLDDCKQGLSTIKTETLWGETINFLIYLIEILIIMVFYSVTTVSLLVSIMAIFYVALKFGNVLGCGTRIGRYREKKQILADIADIESQLTILNKQLHTMKQNAKCIESTLIENNNTLNNDFYFETEKIHYNACDKNKKPKMKILQLKRYNND